MLLADAVQALVADEVLLRGVVDRLCVGHLGGLPIEHLGALPQSQPSWLVLLVPSVTLDL